MKRFLIKNFFLLLVVVAIGGCTRLQKPVITGRSGWTTTGNQRGKLSDYKGKVVVLDFYATWCQPCRAETPRLVAMQDRYGSEGLQVVGLNVGGEDDYEQVPAFARQFNIQYPLAIPDDDLVDMYLSDNQNIPQAFVFDRNGEIVRRFVGYNEDNAQEIEEIVKRVLASKSPAAGE